MLFTAVDGRAADIKERAIKLSYVTAKDSPYGLGVTRFTERARQKSGGKIKVRGYGDGQLGAEVQSIAGGPRGRLEMPVVSTAASRAMSKSLPCSTSPFLFNEEKEAYAVLDGSVGNQLLDKLVDRSLVGLFYWEVGFRREQKQTFGYQAGRLSSFRRQHRFPVGALRERPVPAHGDVR